MYIRIKGTDYKLLSYDEDIDELDKTNMTEGQRNQVLYARMNIQFGGDIIKLRKDIHDQLLADGQVFSVYDDTTNTPCFSYEHAYHKLIRRNVNVDTNEFGTTEVTIKIYLDN